MFGLLLLHHRKLLIFLQSGVGKSSLVQSIFKISPKVSIPLQRYSPSSPFFKCRRRISISHTIVLARQTLSESTLLKRILGLSYMIAKVSKQGRRTIGVPWRGSFAAEAKERCRRESMLYGMFTSILTTCRQRERVTVFVLCN